MIWFLRRAVVVGLILYGTILATLYGFQDGMIFPSPSIEGRTLEVEGFRTVSLTTPDGVRLRTYHHPAEPGEATIIVFHGNGGLAANQHFKGNALKAAQFGVLLAEYRGYGGSSGEPSETGLHTDALAAYNFIRKKSDGPIGIYAHSLGSAMGIKLAKDQQVFAVVLEAPFDSMLAIAQSRYSWLPIKWFLNHPFRSDEIFTDLEQPILILHGDNDQVVPHSHGERLAKLGGENVTFITVKGARHNNLLSHGSAKKAIEFLQSALLNTPSSTSLD